MGLRVSSDVMCDITRRRIWAGGAGGGVEVGPSGNKAPDGLTHLGAIPSLDGIHHVAMNEFQCCQLVSNDPTQRGVEVIHRREDILQSLQAGSPVRG